MKAVRQLALACLLSALAVPVGAAGAVVGAGAGGGAGTAGAAGASAAGGAGSSDKAWWRGNDLGLAVFSTGTWTTYGELHGFSPRDYRKGLRRYEFNKLLAVSLYGRIFGLPAYLGLPLHWTARRTSDGDQHRIAPGDLETYLGKRLGRAEARLGLILPAGYDRGLDYSDPDGGGKAGKPWIGPGNTQVTIGAAVNPNLTRYSRRWEASAEAKWALALDDGIAKAGSWSLFPSAKIAFRPKQRWKSGVEFSGHWKSQHWGRSVDLRDAFDADADWGAGAVATGFLEAYVLPGTAVGMKIGHSLWGYHDAASYNASLYLLYFPN